MSNLRQPELPINTADPKVDPRDKPRLNGQRLKVLQRLRQGPASNAELDTICFRYSARIHELRKAGFCIDKERRDGGLFIYTLRASNVS